MTLEAPKREPFFPVFTAHTIISGVVVIFLVPFAIWGLYMWANSLGTCIKRPSFTLLSMLEESVPWIMRPIQNLVCPH